MTIFFTHKTILTLISKYLPDNPIIVEAGAFNGSDTSRFLAQWPDATVHAFEPVPKIYEQLVARMQNSNQVVCYQQALSNKVGKTLLHIGEKEEKPGIPTQAGSLHAPKERLSWSPIIFPRTIDVRTTTLDAWAIAHQVQHVDMLWLDMQGHELAVLQAAPNTLKTVRVIYTEVGFIEAYAQQPLYEEIKTWLGDQGFTEVGRDFTEQPTWFFGNALFVHNTLL